LPEASNGPHLGYAIQWFAFAVVTLIIFVSLSLRRLPGEAPAATDSPSGPS